MHQKLLLKVLVFLCYCLPSFAQQGDIYLYNYYPSLPNINYQNFAAIQDKRGFLYFANTKGIITYNGVNWDIISTLSTPQALAIDTSGFGRVYVGCTHSFGYLETDIWGKSNYVSISNSNRQFGAVTKIIVQKNYVYFYTDKVLYKVSALTQKVEKVYPARPETSFAGIFTLNDEIFVNITGLGLQRVGNEALIPLYHTIKWGNLYFHTALPFDTKSTLLGANDNKLYLFDGKNLQAFVIDSQKYLDENLLTGGLNLKDNRLVLATLSGGCLVIDKKNRKTIQTINYQTGLPDDEVTAFCTDSFGGLWLCTEYSITRADMNLPVQNFAEYPGLDGQITTMAKMDTNLYVGTSEGIYYLEKINQFEELLTIVQKSEKVIETQTFVEKTIRIARLKERNSVGKFFQSVFGDEDKNKKTERARKREERRQKRNEKKNKDKNETLEVKNAPSEPTEDDLDEALANDSDEIEDIASSISKSEAPPVVNNSTTYIPRLQRNYALMSIPYIYKKIEGLNAKTQQIIAWRNRLLVATNIGLYEVVNKKARLIMGDMHVHYMLQAKPGEFYIGTDQGLFLIKWEEETWNVSVGLREANFDIYTIAIQGKYLWLGGKNQVFKLEINAEGKPIFSKKYPFWNNYSEEIIVRIIQNEPVFFASEGIYTYNAQKDSLNLHPALSKHFNPRSNVHIRQAGYTWVRPRNRWENIQTLDSGDSLKSNFLSLFKEVDDIYADDERNLWIITNNFLYRVSANAQPYRMENFQVNINAIKDIQGNPLGTKDLHLSYYNNALKIELASNFYLSENSTEYQYKVEGLRNEWSAWTNEPVITLSYLPSGTYTVKARARNIFGQLSQEISFKFKVSPPFWQSWWFYVLVLGALIGSTYLLSSIRTRALEHANQKLAQQVELKTSEIESQKQALEVAYEEIERKNKDITDSIRYARRIQEAILPYPETVASLLKDSFILYNPRDVVSGDFYWIEERPDCIVVAVADCTGHGVPGAFMSMIGHSLLNQVVIEQEITDPATILGQLDRGIRKALKQDDEKTNRPDGMDISVIRIPKQGNEITYAGANNPMFIVKRGLCEEIPADRLGIGGLQIFEKTFSNKTYIVHDNCYFYMASDGYFDQIGGPDNKKFMRKKFRALVSQIADLHGPSQKNILNKAFTEWQGNRRQMDDILIVGFRIRG
jgi:serine phosphatase RsbU (regulator of sigma subunit)